MPADEIVHDVTVTGLRSFLASGATLLFDRIVIPHDASEVALSDYGEAPATLVGSIVRKVPKYEAAKSERFILALGGGGGQPVDAARFVRAVADAHQLARALIPDLETLLVTGPYGAPPPTTFAGLTVVRATDLPASLSRAPLVITQAGYNAIAELRALKKPAIVVPAYRKAEDQSLRAKRLARVGAAVIARTEARAIADQIESLLLILESEVEAKCGIKLHYLDPCSSRTARRNRRRQRCSRRSLPRCRG